jgi:imidazole glycerol-phosphate synthase subunit HisH
MDHEPSSKHRRVAIVDYGLGNLFSVKRACEQVGLRAFISGSARELLGSDAVILPGVGAFGDAMAALDREGLIGPLKEIASSGKPLIGVCLGLQLLMTESFEFGRHHGLGILDGPVVRFHNPQGPNGALKVPQVGWNRVNRTDGRTDAWNRTPLDGMEDGEFMYFVHSFYASPEDSDAILAWSSYGHLKFCAAVRKHNVFAFQFHPERSGLAGLRIYRNIARLIETGMTREVLTHV